MYMIWRMHLSVSNSIYQIHTSLLIAGEEYTINSMDDFKLKAQTLSTIPQISMSDLHTLCIAPVNSRNKVELDKFSRMSHQFACGHPIRFHMRKPPVPTTEVDLEVLERKMKNVELYLWLSRRFPHSFIDSEVNVI